MTVPGTTWMSYTDPRLLAEYRRAIIRLEKVALNDAGRLMAWRDIAAIDRVLGVEGDDE